MSCAYFDTASPAAPIIGDIDQDTGTSGDDDVTNDNTLIFTGTAEANSAVTLIEAGLGVIGVVTANGSGVWSINLTGTALADGGYSFTATTEDLAGNISAASSALVVVIDTVSPPAPVISGINQDSGASGSDGVTNDNTLVLNGTAEVGSLVTLSEPGLATIGTATTDSSGNWSFDFTNTVLADASYRFSATATDLAGNISSISAALVVKVDTTAPPPPVIGGIDQDTGSNNSDGLTNDNTLVLSGTAEADSTVVLSEAGLGLIASTIADSSGQWIVDRTSTPLADGTYAFTATAEDLAGNTSGLSSLFIVQVDTALPSIASTSPAQNAIVDGLPGQNVTVELVFSEPMDGPAVIAAISVSGNVNASITPLNTAYDAATNALTFEISESLTDTEITVTLADSARDLAGNALAGGAFNLNFTVERLATITEISPANGEVMVSLTREAIVRFSRPVDPATVTGDAIKVIASGAAVARYAAQSRTEESVGV